MANETWTVTRLLGVTTAFLAEKGSQTPRLDAELLLAKILAMPKIQLYINFERSVSAAELSSYRELIRRRAKHEPVAYILGHREFYGLSLKTTPSALIPRPETEHLVDAAVRLARERWPEGPLTGADIGSGSGAISVALAKSLDQIKMSAVDISPEALALAGENAKALGLDAQIKFFEGDLLEPLKGQSFHLICANLPYIPSGEMAGLMPDVGQYEPALALDGGPEGLTLISRLLETAPAYLEPRGLILLEIWPDSRAELERQATALGFKTLEVVIDLAGRARVAILQLD